MKVRIKDNKSLMIVPETEFEEEYLSRFSSSSETNKIWLKCGLSSAQVVGLVVEKEIFDPRD